MKLDWYTSMPARGPLKLVRYPKVAAREFFKLVWYMKRPARGL